MNYYDSIFRGLTYGSSVFNCCFFNFSMFNGGGNSPHLSFFMGPLGGSNNYASFSGGGAVDFREPTKPSSSFHVPEKPQAPSLIVPPKAEPVAVKPPTADTAAVAKLIEDNRVYSGGEVLEVKPTEVVLAAPSVCKYTPAGIDGNKVNEAINTVTPDWLKVSPGRIHLRRPQLF